MPFLTRLALFFIILQAPTVAFGQYLFHCLPEKSIEVFVESKTNIALVARLTGGLSLSDYLEIMVLLHGDERDIVSIVEQWREVVEPINTKTGVVDLFRVRDFKGVLPVRVKVKSETILEDLELGKLSFVFFEGQDEEGNYILPKGNAFTVTPTVIEYLASDLDKIVMEWLQRTQMC